jgi:hypothetical protein
MQTCINNRAITHVYEVLMASQEITVHSLVHDLLQEWNPVTYAYTSSLKASQQLTPLRGGVVNTTLNSSPHTWLFICLDYHLSPSENDMEESTSI